jgi:hypothetical protein
MALALDFAVLKSIGTTAKLSGTALRGARGGSVFDEVAHSESGKEVQPGADFTGRAAGDVNEGEPGLFHIRGLRRFGTGERGVRLGSAINGGRS